MKRIIEGVYLVAMGNANAFLIEDGDELILIDAGYPGKEEAVLAEIRAINRTPDQLKHLIFTHHHRDHIGSAAAIIRLTGATTYMHALDIPKAATGGPFRPMRPAPGVLGYIMTKLFYDPDQRVEPIAIDRPIADGEILPIAGCMEVVHIPGHCAGQIALHWRRRRILFVGDACMNIMGLGDPVGFEDVEQGRASQRRLAGLSFDVAAFGHGPPIIGRASERFRKIMGHRCTQPLLIQRRAVFAHIHGPMRGDQSYQERLLDRSARKMGAKATGRPVAIDVIDVVCITTLKRDSTAVILSDGPAKCL